MCAAKSEICVDPGGECWSKWRGECWVDAVVVVVVVVVVGVVVVAAGVALLSLEQANINIR